MKRHFHQLPPSFKESTADINILPHLVTTYHHFQNAEDFLREGRREVKEERGEGREKRKEE